MARAFTWNASFFPQDTKTKVWLTTNLKRICTIFYRFLVGGARAQSRPDLSICRNTIHDNKSITPCQEHALTTGHPNPLLLISSHPSFFTVSRASGTRRRGGECSVSFQSFACTSAPGREKRQRGRRRNGEWEVWEGNEQEVQNLIILALVCLAQCHTNLSHLLRVYMGGWIKPNSGGITKGGKA